MRVADGSPFGELLGGKHEATPGMEEQVANYFAKAIYELNTICKRAQPFGRVLIFHSIGSEYGGCNLLTFSTDAENRYALPEPSAEKLKRGASASADFLTWKHGGETIKRMTNIPLGKLHEHFQAKSHTKL